MIEIGLINKDSARDYYLNSIDIYQAVTGTLFCKIDEKRYLLVHAVGIKSNPDYEPRIVSFDNPDTQGYSIFIENVIPNNLTHIKVNNEWIRDAKSLL